MQGDETAEDRSPNGLKKINDLALKQNICMDKFLVF